MSKNNMLLGYARGKVGSLVFSRLKGQQITKAHNASPANPKTYNQMLQRVVLASGVALFKLAQSKFFKFAFEDKKATESDYNAFIRKNLVNFPYVEKADVQAGLIPVDQLIVSSGSLGAYAINVPVAHVYQDLPSGTLAFDADLVSPIFMGVKSGGNTVAKFSENIISQSGGRIQDGDLLTFITFACTDDGVEPTVFTYSQFKIDLADATTITDQGTGMLKVGAFEGGTEKAVVNTGFIDAQADAGMALACALIVTRKEGSAVLASDSPIAVNAAMASLYANKRTSAAKTAAAKSYGATTAAILNPQKY